MVNEINNPNSPYKISIVYGMRGVGKTTFLTEVGKRVEKNPDWIVVDLAMGSNLMAALVDSLYMKAGNELQKIFESIKGLNFSAFGLQLSAEISQPTFSTYQGILTNMFDKLRKKGIKVLITLDEVKSNRELKDFAGYYQLLNQDQKVVLYYFFYKYYKNLGNLIMYLDLLLHMMKYFLFLISSLNHLILCN